MIPIIALIVSIVILSLSYAKSRALLNKEEWFGPNVELDKFYSSSDLSATQMQKQLMLAATTVMRRMKEIEDERAPLYSLAHDRIVSYGLWKLLDKTAKELDIEKMVITSEADMLKEGWSQTIFKEVSALAGKSRAESQSRDRKVSDTLFIKKRETLEKKVLARLTAQNHLKI